MSSAGSSGISRGRIKQALLIGSLIANLLFLPVLWNDHLRFTYSQTLAHWVAKIRPPNTVYLGDSIMAGGRDFGDPTAINLATSGLQTYQIAATLEQAAAQSPKHIVLMAGTNDAVEGPIDAAEHAALWQSICSDPRVTVVLAPPTADAAMNRRIDIVNRIARETCTASGRRILSLDALRGSNGLIRPEYTVDGTHFTEAAYRIMRAKLDEPRS